MISLDEVEPGAQCTHKNTKLRYTVVDVGETEVLLSAQAENMEDLVVPSELFCTEFVLGEGYRGPRRGRGGRSRARRGAPPVPTGPKARGRIKKMVRDRGFGFIRGDDGKEVFFHRSGMPGGEYDTISEGDAVEYVIQEGPRGARAENVRAVQQDSAA